MKVDPQHIYGVIKEVCRYAIADEIADIFNCTYLEPVICTYKTCPKINELKGLTASGKYERQAIEDLYKEKPKSKLYI